MNERFRFRLRDLQDERCALCGKHLLVQHTTIDHVWPRSHPRGRGNQRNHVAAHVACNQQKADRPPTGCELIWLAAVNARRHVRPMPSALHRARRRRLYVPLPRLAELWPSC